MGSSTPDEPDLTPEQVAMERRTTLGLERERAKTERRLKAQARGKLGVQSLLKGIAPEAGLRQEDVVHSQDIANEAVRQAAETARRTEKRKERQKKTRKALLGF